MWLEVLLLLLLEMTEPSRLRGQLIILESDISSAFHFWCGKGMFGSYILLSLIRFWTIVLFENYMFQNVSRSTLCWATIKCMAPSRIQSLVSMTSMTYGQFLCRVPLNPLKLPQVLAWALGKSLQWHWRLSSSRWGWMLRGVSAISCIILLVWQETILCISASGS